MHACKIFVIFLVERKDALKDALQQNPLAK